MTLSSRVVPLATSCAILCSAGAWAQGRPEVATVASYPSGTFLENLSVGSNAALLSTSYLDQWVMTWTGSGDPSVLTDLDVHPFGILSRAAYIVVSAHGASFTDGPAFTATNEMLVLDRDGAVLCRVKAPEALVLNGLVKLTPNAVPVADSLAERIWRFDPTDDAIDVWLVDPLLEVAPDA